MTRSLALCVAALAPLLGGCAQRSISITSTPPGALVYLNDQEVGRTPLDVDFRFYGTYDVRLVLPGHEPLLTSREAAAPWYEYPGPDLLAAAFPVRTELAWHFELQPVAEAGDKEAAQAAAVQRGRDLRATITPADESAGAGKDAPATSATPAPPPAPQ